VIHAAVAVRRSTYLDVILHLFAISVFFRDTDSFLAVLRAADGSGEFNYAFVVRGRSDARETRVRLNLALDIIASAHVALRHRS
jgi:hypothetical protein